MDFPFTCTIHPYISTDRDHNRTYGDPVSSSCYFQQTTEIFQGAAGSELISFAWLALPPETTLHKHDKITLPDGSEPYIRSFYPNYRLSDNEIEYITVNLANDATGAEN